MRMRLLALSSLMALSILLVPTPSPDASAAGEMEAPEGSIFGSYTVATFSMDADPDGPGSGSVELVDSSGWYVVEDPNGEIVDEGPVAPSALFSPSGGGGESGDCNEDGSTDGFKYHGFSDVTSPPNGGVWFQQYLFFVYSQTPAQDEVDSPYNDDTFQILICSAGGQDFGGGWRQILTGSGMTYLHSNPHRIDWSWERGTGSDTSDLALSLSFKVSHPRVPVEVEGTIEFHPTSEYFDGSFLPPQQDPLFAPMEDHAHNAVNGWWEHGCRRGAVPCLPWQGSSHFQGSTVLGLWEWPMSVLYDPEVEELKFMVAAYSESSCANPLGCEVPDDEWQPDGD